MSADVRSILEDLGRTIFGQAKTNLGDAVKQLTANDLLIIERATMRKAEFLLAGLLGQDIAADEAEIDATLGFLGSKASAIVRDTLKTTVLDAVTTAGKVALKLIFGAIIP